MDITDGRGGTRHYQQTGLSENHRRIRTEKERIQGSIVRFPKRDHPAEQGQEEKIRVTDSALSLVFEHGDVSECQGIGPSTMLKLVNRTGVKEI